MASAPVPEAATRSADVATVAPPTAAECVRLAQGFLLLLLGLGVTFLLATRAVRAAALDAFLMPAYVPALAVIYAGLRQTRRRAFSDPASPATRRSLAPVVALLYLAPFVVWWERAPHHAFFLVHMALLALAGAWLLFEVNRIGARSAQWLGAPVYALEARLCGLVAVASAVPIPWLLGYAGWMARRNDTSLYGECFRLLYHLPRGWIAVALLPISLTLASCWRLRGAALAALAKRS